MLETENFLTLLKSRLLQGNKIRLYYISTAPTSCPALFAPGPGASEVATTVESHFLVISQSRTQSTDPKNSASDVAVLGIEVLIFTTNELTTIFVSKADSTGLLLRSANAAPRQTSLAQITITAFLESLLSRRLDRNRVVLSLFARSQNQYLFPGSIENATKHVLDDRQLIKWWCRILDPLARRVANSALQHVNAHVVVPGCDIGETKAFFPPSALSDSASLPFWRNAYPVDLLTNNTSLPVRCLVPRLPDDPKSRFLDDLDAQQDAGGNWRGVKTLDQFWELMSYRQECSAGRLVGFVWVIFSPAMTTSAVSKSELTTVTSTNLDTRGEESKKISMRVQHDGLQEEAEYERMQQKSVQRMTKHDDTPVEMSTLTDTAKDSLSNIPLASCVKSSSDGPMGQQSTISSKLENEKLSNKTSVRDDLTATQPNLEENSTTAIPRIVDGTNLDATDVPGGLIVSVEHYQILMDEILELDFAGEETAMESTTRWRNRIIELSGIAQVGTEVEGTATAESNPAVASDVAMGSKSPQPVNILTGLRKKRKAELNKTASDSHAEEPTAVNNLTTDLIRKKPKT